MSLLPAAGICYTVSTLLIPIVSCGQIALETIRKWEIFIMSDERGQNLFIIAYPGRETADKVYDHLTYLRAILRLYGPLEPWFGRTWKPGDVEAVE